MLTYNSPKLCRHIRLKPTHETKTYKRTRPTTLLLYQLRSLPQCDESLCPQAMTFSMEELMYSMYVAVMRRCGSVFYQIADHNSTLY